jgi:alpha-L-arabinofuranosidase
VPAISCSSSRDAAGRTHIPLTNIDPRKSQKVNLEVRGVSFSTVSGRVLTSQNIQDHNTFQHPDQVKPTPFKDAKFRRGSLEVTLPPASVVVLEVK